MLAQGVGSSLLGSSITLDAGGSTGSGGLNSGGVWGWVTLALSLAGNIASSAGVDAGDDSGLRGVGRLNGATLWHGNGQSGEDDCGHGEGAGKLHFGGIGLFEKTVIQLSLG